MRRSTAALRQRASASSVRALRDGARVRLLLLALVAFCALVACSDSPAATDPHGEGANVPNDLWWTMFGISAVIFTGVMIWLAVGLLRRRRNEGPSPGQRDPGWGIGLILGGGVGLPLVVLSVLMALTIRGIHTLTGDAPPHALQVEVVAHDWWWEFRYDGIVTANELHIPVGEPVEFRGNTADVIHSFWVPQLAGKIDLIPGKDQRFVFQADNAGEYRGQCAEFCGVQHAHMALFLVAEPRPQFEAWVAGQRQAAADPTTALVSRGRDIFMGLSCVSCHNIDGTPANGRAGPDLTHLASRTTFAAGTADLNRETLRAWIMDPATYKPGVLMPAFPTLDSDALNALVAYLLSLK